MATNSFHPLWASDPSQNGGAYNPYGATRNPMTAPGTPGSGAQPGAWAQGYGQGGSAPSYSPATSGAMPGPWMNAQQRSGQYGYQQNQPYQGQYGAMPSSGGMYGSNNPYGAPAMAPGQNSFGGGQTPGVTMPAGGGDATPYTPHATGVTLAPGGGNDSMAASGGAMPGAWMQRNQGSAPQSHLASQLNQAVAGPSSMNQMNPAGGTSGMWYAIGASNGVTPGAPPPTYPKGQSPADYAAAGVPYSSQFSINDLLAASPRGSMPAGSTAGVQTGHTNPNGTSTLAGNSQQTANTVQQNFGGYVNGRFQLPQVDEARNPWSLSYSTNPNVHRWNGVMV